MPVLPSIESAEMPDSAEHIQQHFALQALGLFRSSRPFQSNILKRRRPRKRIDLHQRGPEADGVGPPAGSEAAARHFTGSYQRRVIPVAGHFLPREAPEAVVAAIKELDGGS